MTKKDKIKDYALCIMTGMIVAFAFIATICGDGDKGLLDLF